MGIDAVAANLALRVLGALATAASRAIGRGVPKWVDRLRRFEKRKRLKAQVSEDEVTILRCISGRQQDYAYIQERLAGRLEGESLLSAVTHLQALRLLNEPRLAHPPHLRALFTVSGDASLLLETKRRPKLPRPRRAKVREASSRRQRLADNSEWICFHTRPSTAMPAQNGGGVAAEARRRRAEIEEDEAWLESHGYRAVDRMSN